MHRTALVLLSVVTTFSLEASADPAGTVDRTQLRAELAARREVNLARFRAYRRAGVYPHNTYEGGMRNVWRDADDHLCAVANMVARDGLDELVDDTAAQHNFVRIADVQSGPLIDWVLTSGFTQEEIVMIQWPTWAEDDPVGYRQAMERQRREERARKKEDRRLAKGYLATEHALRERVVRDAGLDLAVARLAARPELIARLHARAAAPTPRRSGKR